MKSENSSVPFEEVLNQFNFLVTSKRGKPLNDSETLLIEGIWNKKTYVEMAEGSRYSANYLHRTLAPRMFSQLTNSLGKGEINKHNLRIILEQVVENDTYQLSSLRKILENKVRGDTIPDISDFYGRTNELAILKEKISQNKNRCVSILGSAGIGKSALVAKLIADLIIDSQFDKETNFEFDYFVWKSVGHKPPIKDLVTELLALVDPVHNFSSLPDNVNSRISALMQPLKKKCFVIVLDDFSVENNPNYELFLRRLVEERHRSLFVLTSRELPDIAKKLIKSRPMDSFKLEGLDNLSAMELLASYKLNNEHSCSELIDKYRGNPSELIELAHRIHNVFGSEKVFSQNPTTLVSDKFSSILDEVFSQKLTPLEKQILLYIDKATDKLGHAIQFSQLLTGLKQTTSSTSEIVKIIEKLENFHLIEKYKSPDQEEISFAIQPAIKKYIKTSSKELVDR